MRRQRKGLLCGKGVEPPRGRGRLSGARESQLFFGYIITTKMFSKMHLDITPTKGNFWYLVLLINLSPMSVSDVQRSLQSCVSTIQSVGLTADVFHPYHIMLLGSERDDDDNVQMDL